MVYPYAVNIREILRFEQVSNLCRAVSPKRQEQIAQYRFDRDKIRCLTAELLVRYALAERFGMNHYTISFLRTDNGKPFLANSDVHFNMSHSGDWVVCAVGLSEIGIDVERMRQTDNRDMHVFFAKSESELLNRAKPYAQADLFYRLWTLKESYVKYCGTGLRHPFSDFAVDFRPDGGAKLTRATVGDTNVAFDSRKLDSLHWYALCAPEGARMAGICTVSAQTLFRDAKADVTVCDDGTYSI